MKLGFIFSFCNSLCPWDLCTEKFHHPAKCRWTSRISIILTIANKTKTRGHSRVHWAVWHWSCQGGAGEAQQTLPSAHPLLTQLWHRSLSMAEISPQWVFFDSCLLQAQNWFLQRGTSVKLTPYMCPNKGFFFVWILELVWSHFSVCLFHEFVCLKTAEKNRCNFFYYFSETLENGPNKCERWVRECAISPYAYFYSFPDIA